MKQVRPLGRVTAGPESKILEGGSVLEERVAGDGEASRPYSAAGDGRDMPYEYKVRSGEVHENVVVQRLREWHFLTTAQPWNHLYVLPDKFSEARHLLLEKTLSGHSISYAGGRGLEGHHPA